MNFNRADIDRIIMMAWEDRTPYEAIEAQFGLKEKDVKKLMRNAQTSKSYSRWRERVNGRTTKQAIRRNSSIERFKSPMQKT